MSDLIHLLHGAPPWEPTPDTESVYLLDEYNIPLAGIVRQHGVLFLYVCAAGEEDETNVWIYANISNEEAQVLTQAKGQQLLPAMRAGIENRMIITALAAEWQLVDWDHFDAGQESPGVLVRRYLRRLQAKLRQRQDAVTSLERDPSIADSAAPEQLVIC